MILTFNNPYYIGLGARGCVKYIFNATSLLIVLKFILITPLFVIDSFFFEFLEVEEDEYFELSIFFEFVILAPLVENLLMILFYFFLKKSFSLEVAVLLVALVFGFLHGSILWPAFFSSLLGFYFYLKSYIYWRDKGFLTSFFVAYFIHVFNNAFSFLPILIF